MAFRADREIVEGLDVLKLSDTKAGAFVCIVPALGFNMFRLHLPVDGRPTPVLVEPPTLAELKANPSRYGHPILFPFPNRIRNGRFTWSGQEYEIPVNASGHAIHGFALRSSWRLISLEASADQAMARGEWQLSTDAPDQRRHWPADARLEVAYILSEKGLQIDATVSNPDSVDLPWGLGYHTYFRLPLSDDVDTRETTVIVPAARRWVLDGFLPTGEKEPVPPNLDFRNGRPLSGLKADDVLTSLDHGADGQVECHLRDTKIGWEVVMVTSKEFTEMVVFTPSWNANTIALEPYTQTTDAINLAARGIEGGLKTLSPGQSQKLQVTIRTQPISGNG